MLCHTFINLFFNRLLNSFLNMLFKTLIFINIGKWFNSLVNHIRVKTRLFILILLNNLFSSFDGIFVSYVLGVWLWNGEFRLWFWYCLIIFRVRFNIFRLEYLLWFWYLASIVISSLLWLGPSNLIMNSSKFVHRCR